MAKLIEFYKLCPLIDQQNLLGIEKDSESGCAIVTLGRNFIVRYDLINIKQLTSWSSKDRLSTQVIYDETSKKYVGIFNGTSVRLWSKEEWTLDKVKKHKFSHPLFAVLTYKNFPAILIQQNGATVSLDWALENRKNLAAEGFLKNNEQILTCQLVESAGQLSVCFLIKDGNHLNCIVHPLDKDNNYIGKSEASIRVLIKNSDEKLMGNLIIQEKNNASILTLWSNGCLYKYSLNKNAQEEFPGSFLSKISKLSCDHPIKLVSINGNTIAAYGADKVDKSAAVIIYNLSFKLVQAQQTLDLYTQEAELWRIDDKIILAANGSLLATLYELAPQRIEARLGCHLKLEEHQNIKIKNFKKISKTVSKLQNQGLSNTLIQKQLIPQSIEAKDVQSIYWYLNNFDDITEDLLVSILQFWISTTDDTYPSENSSDNVDHHVTKEKLICKILSCNFSHSLLLPHLKNLKLEEALFLVKYLIDKFQDDTDENIDLEQESYNYKLLSDWASALFDTFYQKLLFFFDSQITELIEALKEIIRKHLAVLYEMKDVRPSIDGLLNGYLLNSIPQDANTFYSIEEIKLY